MKTANDSTKELAAKLAQMEKNMNEKMMKQELKIKYKKKFALLTQLQVQKSQIELAAAKASDSRESELKNTVDLLEQRIELTTPIMQRTAPTYSYGYVGSRGPDSPAGHY